MAQIFFNIYYGNDFIRVYIFHANLLTVSSSFAEEVRYARRVGGYGNGKELGFLSTEFLVCCWFCSSFYTWLYTLCFACQCQCVVFLFNFILPPFWSLPQKVYSTKFAYLNVCMKGAFFERGRHATTRTSQHCPPPPSPQSKLFVEFILYKMRARLLYTVY